MANVFKKVVIFSVTAEGFKGFKDSISVKLEEKKNLFIGDNGLGKSSIGELIVWVITGKSVDGKTKELNFMNKECSATKGVVTFLDENGKPHEVSRKVASSVTLKFDREKVTQKQLDEMIPPDLFLAIFNPLYFLSLDSEACRKAIDSLIPTITKADVLKSMSPFERDFLEKEDFDENDTNTYLKERRKELKDIEESEIYLKGYMAKSDEPILLPARIKFDASKLAEVEKALETLSQRKPNLINLTDLLVKKNELEGQILKIRSEVFESEKVKLELENKKVLLQQELANEETKEYKATNTSELETKIAVLRTDYKATSCTHNSLEEEKKALGQKKIKFHEGDKCPYCQQKITKQTVDMLNLELRKQVEGERAKIEAKQTDAKKSLAQLEREGKALLGEITKAKEENERQLKAFNDAKKQRISELKKQIQSIDKQLQSLSKLESQFYMKQQEGIRPLEQAIADLKIGELEGKNAEAQKSFDAMIQKERGELQLRLSELKKEQETVIANDLNIANLEKQAEENEKTLRAKKEELEVFKQKKVEINNKITLMKLFNTQKTKLTNATVSKHLIHVSLKLQKAVEATGEIKNCFEILYMGKELKLCSTSETIKAGLEISQMMSVLSGLEYPVFVDNGESVTEYQALSSQMIEAKVVKDAKLSLIRKGIPDEIVMSATSGEKSRIA